MIQTKWIALKIPLNGIFSDTTASLWAEKCISVRCNQHVTLSETELIDPLFSFTEPVAYALKKQKKGMDSHLK